MNTYIFIGVYCAMALGVSAAFFVLTKNLLLHALASSITSAMLLQLIAYLYLGEVDGWAYIGFVISWFIGLGCAVAYYFVATRIRERRAKSATG